MVNGVLVERTVKDVLPALKTNSDGLKQVLDELVKQYQSKQSELDDWKKKNNIQVVQPWIKARFPLFLRWQPAIPLHSYSILLAVLVSMIYFRYHEWESESKRRWRASRGDCILSVSEPSTLWIDWAYTLSSSQRKRRIIACHIGSLSVTYDGALTALHPPVPRNQVQRG